MSDTSTYEDGYRDGFVAGYGAGSADGRNAGYSNAKYRAHAAGDAVELPRDQRTLVAQALVEHVGKLEIG